jgi:hypothetical protein
VTRLRRDEGEKNRVGCKFEQGGAELDARYFPRCQRRAEDFLRWLYREGRLESSELKERLRALEKMASGKLRPVVNVKPRTPEAARPEREGWG